MTEGARINPLTLSVVRHKLQAIAEEMTEIMTHTCFSPILNQNQDFSTVVADVSGNTIAQAERVPIHMGAMSTALRIMIERFRGDIHKGDIFIANDPYFGGSHLPDITMVKPVFSGDDICMWVSIRAHQGDIGGISAGGYSPSAREIWHEGLRISPVRLVSRGETRTDLLDFIAVNSRKPEDLKGDLMAQISAVNIGEERVSALLKHYGNDEIARCCAGILEAGEISMRNMLRQCKPGKFRGVSFLENENGLPPLPVSAMVEIREGEAVVDLRECPEQVNNFLNSPIANTLAAVNVAFLYLCNDVMQLNDGSARAIRLLTTRGSLVHPTEPAPVVACTSLTAGAIIEAVLLALAESLPDNAIAGFARRYRFAMTSRDSEGHSFIWHYFFNRGGAGANALHDGWCNLGGIHNPGGTPSPGLERTETNYPLIFEDYSLRPDSCGAGKQRGGLGGRMVIRYTGQEEGQLNLSGAGTDVRPYGLFDGYEGQGHHCEILRPNGENIILSGRENGVPLRAGDKLVCLSAGGGGYGDAAERDRALIEYDLNNGYITAEYARAHYVNQV
ncbi:TPA: hydantoinase B/oxoprolinase family protein [Klebsiella michiganensis]|nr:hydantoinase B/oxoprolinase family protein [Klebsiella michiganensis]